MTELKALLLSFQMIQRYAEGQVVLRKQGDCRRIGQAGRVGKEVADAIQCGKV